MASCLSPCAVYLLPLAFHTWLSAYYILLGALCSEADAQGRLVPIGSCLLPLTCAHGLISAALDLIATFHACHSLLPVVVAFCQLLCAL